MNSNQQLTPTDRQLLAREVATEKAYYNSDYRDAYRAGWDAAMGWAIKERDAECGFCWVCRSHHRLVADQCRAMDGVV